MSSRTVSIRRSATTSGLTLKRPSEIACLISLTCAWLTTGTLDKLVCTDCSCDDNADSWTSLEPLSAGALAGAAPLPAGAGRCLLGCRGARGTDGIVDFHDFAFPAIYLFTALPAVTLSVSVSGCAINYLNGKSAGTFNPALHLFRLKTDIHHAARARNAADGGTGRRSHLNDLAVGRLAQSLAFGAHDKAGAVGLQDD